MNIANLFEVQRKLDAEIERKHPVAPGEDRLAKRILALQVELGELANEQRSWKFWSNDQEPRIKSYSWISMGEIKKSKTDPRGAVDNAIHFNGFSEKNPLLEEYVDCLHFVLSIGNGLVNLNADKYINEPIKYESVTEQFNEIFGTVHAQTSFPELYWELFNEFIGLGELLGFTWEQIESAYMSKNETNWKRQADGY